MKFEPEEESEGYQFVEEDEKPNRFIGEIFDEKIAFDPFRRKAAQRYKLQFSDEGEPGKEWDNNPFSGKQNHRFMSERERTGKRSKMRQKRKFTKRANLDKRY